jgi:hypothetical protein
MILDMLRASRKESLPFHADCADLVELRISAARLLPFGSKIPPPSSPGPLWTFEMDADEGFAVEAFDLYIGGRGCRSAHDRH